MLHHLKLNLRLLLFVELERSRELTFSVMVFYFSRGIFDARTHRFQLEGGKCNEMDTFVRAKI